MQIKDNFFDVLGYIRDLYISHKSGEKGFSDILEQTKQDVLGNPVLQQLGTKVHRDYLNLKTAIRKNIEGVEDIACAFYVATLSKHHDHFN